MRYALLLLLVLGCVPGQLAFAERPPQAPPVIEFVTTSAPVRSDECDCQDKNEADGCACPKCECKLCVGRAVDLNETNGTYQTSTSAVSIKTIAMQPPVPQVTPAPPLSFQKGNVSAGAEVGVSSDDMARLNEAHRRMREAGYEWKEFDEAELCDTCPAGFRYTGKTFFTAVKNYDEGQIVGSSDPTYSPGPSSAPVSYSSYPGYSYSTRSSFGEASCGSDYSYSAPVYEASCGSEGVYGASYGVQSYGGPFRGGLLQRLRERFSRRSAGPVSTYSTGYSSPRYFAPARSYGVGACLTGNCG